MSCDNYAVDAEDIFFDTDRNQSESELEDENSKLMFDFDEETNDDFEKRMAQCRIIEDNVDKISATMSTEWYSETATMTIKSSGILLTIQCYPNPHCVQPFQEKYPYDQDPRNSKIDFILSCSELEIISLEDMVTLAQETLDHIIAYLKKYKKHKPFGTITVSSRAMGVLMETFAGTYFGHLYRFSLEQASVGWALRYVFRY